MRKPFFAFLCVSLLFTSILAFQSTDSMADDAETWVVLIAGFDAGSLWHPFLTNSYYAYFVFAHQFGVPDSETDEHIKYYYNHFPLELEYDTVDGPSTKENVRSAIAWLSTVSDDNDNIFIYITCHGAGALQNGTIEGGARIDSEEDEGGEFCLNGTWFGVDELLEVYVDPWTGRSEDYFDDEFKQDLSNVTCGQMVILLQACVMGNKTCFSGGFIDDLSATNRIIITSSNETGVSWGDYSVDFQLGVEDGFSEFSEGFFDALYGFDTWMDGDNFITDYNHPIDADADGNSIVDYEEAFQWAFEHDDARWAVRTLNGTVPDPLDEYEASIGEAVDETPWFDGDGDGLPTFKAGCDVFLLGDFNFDGVVDIQDYQMFENVYKYGPYHPLYDLDDDGDVDAWDFFTMLRCVEKRTLSIKASYGGTTDPPPSNYTYILNSVVMVTAWPNDGWKVDCWRLDNSPLYEDVSQISVTMNVNHVLHVWFIGSDGGAGGGQCPTLFVWNGSGYVDYGVLGIHNATGADVVRTVALDVSDVCVSGFQVHLRLREGREGLNFSESVVDQVRLFVVDAEGMSHLCLLVAARHSRLGNVLLQLLFSDDCRAQMLLLETIDLTFVVPCQNVQGFTFLIEGCNRIKE